MSNKPGRSVRRFERELDKAVDRRERMLSDDKLSLVSGCGKLAIIVSDQVNYGSRYDPGTQIRSFMEEADRLAEARKSKHQAVEIRRKAVAREIGLDLKNPEITDMIFIGNGTIADIWTSGGKHFNWLEVSKTTSFLKQGSIEQRVCGHFPLKTSVPLGTFALSDQTNLVAPTGVLIPDFDPSDESFARVYTEPNNSSGDIKNLIDLHYDPNSGKPNTTSTI